MNRELSRGLFKTKTNYASVQGRASCKPKGFREFCLTCDDGDLSKTVIIDITNIIVSWLDKVCHGIAVQVTCYISCLVLVLFPWFEWTC